MGSVILPSYYKIYAEKSPQGSDGPCWEAVCDIIQWIYDKSLSVDEISPHPGNLHHVIHSIQLPLNFLHTFLYSENINCFSHSQTKVKLISECSSCIGVDWSSIWWAQKFSHLITTLMLKNLPRGVMDPVGKLCSISQSGYTTKASE